MCPVSGFSIDEIEPRLFSFNNPYGAPYGLLKLNNLGSISSILNPLTGHMNLSDNVIISLSSILNTSTLPSLSFKLISILFANLSLLSFDGIILSITTLIAVSYTHLTLPTNA